MSLKTEKRIAVAGAAVVGVAVVGLGLGHIFSGASSPHQPASPPVPVTQPVPVQTPVTQPPVTPVNPPVVVDNQQQVLHDLEQGDLRGLHSHGLKVSPPTRAFGRTCNNDGTTDGAGYQGSNTAISYDVSRDGKTGKACVSHPSGDVKVKWDQAATQPAPQTFSPVPALEAADKQGLANKGVYVQGEPLSLGSYCNGDGTTDGTGDHGAQTAISYRIERNGHYGKVCVTHPSGDVKLKLDR